MEQRKLVISALALLILVSWAHSAQANTINTSVQCYTLNGQGPGPGVLVNTEGDPYSGNFDSFQASSPGTFNQEISFDLRPVATIWTIWGRSSPGPDHMVVSGPIFFEINSHIASEGLLKFDWVEWTVNISGDGINWQNDPIRTTPEAAMNAPYGYFEAYLNSSYALSVPLNWYYDPVYGGWNVWGHEYFDFHVVVTQLVHAVPLPPTLLLLVSGLMRLGFYGRRKWSGRIEG